MIFLLIHSPLVGPTTWDGVGDHLTSLGHDVTIPSLVTAVSATEGFHEKFVDLGCNEAPGNAWVVGHSGAGQLLPDVARRLNGNGVVYVDAGLPHPGRSRLDDMPGELASRLRDLGGDTDIVPPWPSWFPYEVLQNLVPDETLLNDFVADCPSLRWSMLTERIPEFEWRQLPSCYLRLSAGYKSHADEAASMGWRVESIDGHHLWPLVHPAEVADAILQLTS